MKNDFSILRYAYHSKKKENYMLQFSEYISMIWIKTHHMAYKDTF